jgi:hypothetical protein
MSKRMTFFLALVLVMMTAAWGCGNKGGSGISGGSDGIGGLPSGSPDITGSIESISGDARGFADPGEVVGAILVEGTPGVASAYDRASVSINGRTRIFTRAPGAEPVPADILALGIGRQVEVWFTGPVAESYPVQALADVIYVVVKGEAAADIFQVKDANTAELMSVPGVVGVGIGGTAGEMHIVVYLENASPELKARIPSELGGYPVVVEVTGTITPQ